MPDLTETLAIAKRGGYTRAEAYAALSAIAEQRREPGQTEAQAFTKLISTPEGAALYQIQKSLPGRDIDPAWSSPIARSAPSTWDALVTAQQRLHKCSRGAAIDHALADEGGRFLFAMQKRDERVQTGQYTVADMQMLDAIDEQAQAADLHKRHEPRHEYEEELDKVRQLYPRLTESKVHDEARKRKPEAWEQYKKLNKLGGGHLPQAHGQREQAGDEHPAAATSGRTDPLWSPLWRSDHSSSRPVTPARAPERPSELPSIKRWSDAVTRLAFNCGYSRERAGEILKATAPGHALFKRIMSEAAAACEAAAAREAEGL
jgi:hypothetical protein